MPIIIHFGLAALTFSVSHFTSRAPRSSCCYCHTSACYGTFIRQRRQQRFGPKSTFYANVPLLKRSPKNIVEIEPLLKKLRGVKWALQAPNQFTVNITVGGAMLTQGHAGLFEP
jgi:hypothetical protein